ncbi:MAG: tRNA uridine(34) 5-carboxymethylaminomethyl modification radical SAM/GNAT enzyme Elp3 [Nanoarchaeota archaeon]|nr:tRNA uridine(34) 5-carboxymethylaminomethyl modification radical SAM/GNAT enzyme Elp3 [Nanoarchaeota archaeon]
MSNNTKEAIKELVKEVDKGKIKTQQQLNNLKIKISKKYKLPKIPSNSQIIINIPKSKLKKYANLFSTKPVRALSGVSTVAVMTKPIKCPHAKKGGGPCIMCPGGPDSSFGSVPQSYTGNEPASKRAARNLYNPYFQIFNRLQQYLLLGHFPSKIELIIMGGTFPSFPTTYQNNFIKDCFKALNDFSKLFLKDNKINWKKFISFFELNFENRMDKQKEIHKKIKEIYNKRKTTLEKEQKTNEKTVSRCIALAIETRPDYCTQKHINLMLKQGCTRVELGVQSIYDPVLKKIERGHSVKETIEATKLLKDSCLKVGYHLLLGAPGSSTKKDLMMLKEIFFNENFKPDALKLYPCMVFKGTKLYDLYKKKEYTPLTTEKAAKLIAEAKKYVPPYCRIMRVQRDIPSNLAAAGVDKTNLRQYVQKELKENKIICQCIRCKQITSKDKLGKVELRRFNYLASKGKEIFLYLTTNHKLVGFCRLRVTENKYLLLRELHIYSESLPLQTKAKAGQFQHRGFGKLLMQEAEKIAKEFKKDKITVISGIGVKEYYKNLGYKKQGPYMTKSKI